jgi:hypothetical protein
MNLKRVGKSAHLSLKLNQLMPQKEMRKLINWKLFKIINN